MKKGINKMIVLGNVGSDPVITSTKTGNMVASMSIATSESWTDKETNEKMENTEWHRIVFFGKRAEVIEKYVKKGDKCYVEGKLKTEKWTDKENIEHTTTKIIGEDLQLLGQK